MTPQRRRILVVTGAALILSWLAGALHAGAGMLTLALIVCGGGLWLTAYPVPDDPPVIPRAPRNEDDPLWSRKDMP